MDEQYTSSELFHFVGHKDPIDHSVNFETLRSVLKSQCISYSPEDVSWGPVRHEVDWERSLLDEELVVPTITCYADIPKKHLKIHMKKYGYFGVSIERKYLIQFHARPVTYIPTYTNDHLGISGRTLLRDIESAIKGFHKYHLNNDKKPRCSRGLGNLPNDKDEATSVVESTLLKDFIGFIKPFNSELSEDDPDNFYLEREWRKLGNIKFDENVICTVVILRGYEQAFIKEFPQYESRLMVVDEHT